MRFAYLSEIYPQHGETWIRYEIEELLARGHEVHLFATHARPPAGSTRPPALGLGLTYVPEVGTPATLAGLLRVGPAAERLHALAATTRDPRRLLRFARAAWQAAALARAVAAFDPHMIVCPFAGNRALVGCLLAAMVGRPYLVITHAVDIWQRRPEMAVFHATAHELWTISRFNQDYLSAIYPELSWDALRLVRVGIQLDEFPFAPSDGASREVAFVGRLVPTKGADMLLRATALLKARGHQFQTVLMGAGPELPALRALADELQLGSAVTFAGSTPSAEVARRLREAAVFVLPCQPDPVWMDGIPVALMEAMAIGTPVVTTATSGIPELVHHGENGFFVAPDDIAGLAACIEQVWSLTPEARSALVGRARATVEAHYQVGAVVDELVRAATHAAAHPAVAYTPVSIP